MDVREKLVELLGNIYLPMMAGPDVIGEYRIPHKFKKEIADHLIAHGVTVQEWISVNDRLPKGCNGEDLSENVIAYLNNGEIAEVCTGWCNGDQWWLLCGDRDTHTSWGMGAVTHWMPLPEPPKV